MRPPSAVTTFTEDEVALQLAARQFATREIGPLVRSMDANSKMGPAIIQGLFEQSLMGVEVPAEYGGCGATFTSALSVIEELPVLC